MNYLLRIKNAQRLIKKSHLSSFLITDKSNIAYLTGFTGSNGFVLISTTKTFLFTDSRYIERAKYTVPKFIKLVNITKLWRNPKELKKEWSKILKTLKIKSIGFEGNHMTVNKFKKYKKISARAFTKFKDISGEIESLRAIKDTDELALIKKSQSINDRTFELIKKFIHHSLKSNKKISEMDVFWEIKKTGFNLGAEDVSFDPIVAFGKNTSMPHHLSGKTTLKKGDLILIDMGMKYKGYCSDMTRMIFTATPTKQQKHIYDLVLKAQENLLHKAKQNFSEQKIDSLARDVINQANYKENFTHGTGHGVGLEIHESPSLSDNKTPPKKIKLLKPGMVVTVEPGIYLEKNFGVRIEDMAIVTKTGLKNITKTPKKI